MERERLGFEITELRLGLPGGVPIQSSRDHGNEKKRVFSDDDDNNGEEGKSGTGIDDDRRGRKRNRVVGWPPVCSYRRRNKDQSETGKKYVKVSMDGAPFLRKLDLGMVKGYAELGVAMENLFGCSIRRFEYIHTYEDGDGDWMLMGDVPWKMFIESCSRLRIMKRSEANGSEVPIFSQSRSASSK